MGEETRLSEKFPRVFTPSGEIPDELSKPLGSMGRGIEQLHNELVRVVNRNVVKYKSQASQPTPLDGEFNLWKDSDAAGAEPSHYLVYNDAGTVIAIPESAFGGAFNEIASQAEAEAGTENTKGMTALRVKQAIAALAPEAFAAGTLMLFQQTAAPTGWTKETTHDDKALRIITGTVGSAGATAFSSVFGASKVTGGRSLSTAQLASHTHVQQSNTKLATGSPSAPVTQIGFSSATGGTTQARGSGSTHDHTLSLDLQYVDFIIASKD